MSDAGTAFSFAAKKQKTFASGSGMATRVCFAVAGLLALAPAQALADAATRNNISAITATTGEGLYQHVCQGCHMPGGAGAVGAGHFPALARDKRLAAAGYPVAMVLRGNGGMPWFNGMLDDNQIAAVVNYVRTHFGNDYKDAVTPAYVASVKGPVPVLEQ